jgi:hypothetical protein
MLRSSFLLNCRPGLRCDPGLPLRIDLPTLDRKSVVGMVQVRLLEEEKMKIRSSQISYGLRSWPSRAADSSAPVEVPSS